MHTYDYSTVITVNQLFDSHDALYKCSATEALSQHISLLYQWHILHMHRQYSELELSLEVFVIY